MERIESGARAKLDERVRAVRESVRVAVAATRGKRGRPQGEWNRDP